MMTIKAKFIITTVIIITVWINKGSLSLGHHDDSNTTSPRKDKRNARTKGISYVSVRIEPLLLIGAHHNS